MVCAVNGLVAVQAARQEPFDRVFMDCQMPEMDGLDATAAIRALERDGTLAPVAGRPHPPFVALTANAMLGDRERCLAAGMDAFLAKPISRDQLREMVESVLGRSTRAGPASA